MKQVLHRAGLAILGVVVCLVSAACRHEEKQPESSVLLAEADRLVTIQSSDSDRDDAQRDALIMYGHALENMLSSPRAGRSAAYAALGRAQACVGQRVDRKFRQRTTGQIEKVLISTSKRRRSYRAYLTESTVAPSASPDVDACAQV